MRGVNITPIVLPGTPIAVLEGRKIRSTTLTGKTQNNFYLGSLITAWVPRNSHSRIFHISYNDQQTAPPHTVTQNAKAQKKNRITEGGKAPPHTLFLPKKPTPNFYRGEIWTLGGTQKKYSCEIFSLSECKMLYKARVFTLKMYTMSKQFLCCTYNIKGSFFL